MDVKVDPQHTGGRALRQTPWKAMLSTVFKINMKGEPGESKVPQGRASKDSIGPRIGTGEVDEVRVKATGMRKNIRATEAQAPQEEEERHLYS
jgi:hypothetical protein